MKFLIIILSFLILYLTINPGLEMILSKTPTEQSCCGDYCELIVDLKKSSEQKNQKDDCSGKSCNPFQVCSVCVFHFPSEFNLSVSIPVYNNLKFTYKSLFLSQFTSDFWHPPKLI